MYDVPGIPLGLTSANLFGNNAEANPCPICISPSLLFRKLSPPALSRPLRGSANRCRASLWWQDISTAFYFLSVVVKGMQLGVAYAIWCGVGIVLVALAGILLYKQVPDFPAILGMGLIIAGVIIMNVFSKTVGD